MLLDSLLTSPLQRAVVALTLVGVPVLVWGLSRLDVPAIASAFGGVSAAMAGALSLLGKATAVVRSRLGALDQAQQQVSEEIGEARRTLDQRIDAAEKNIEAADERLRDVIDEQAALTSRLKTIQDELEQITPARVITDFVAEWVESGDYRKHLGIRALI